MFKTKNWLRRAKGSWLKVEDYEEEIYEASDGGNGDRCHAVAGGDQPHVHTDEWGWWQPDYE